MDGDSQGIVAAVAKEPSATSRPRVAALDEQNLESGRPRHSEAKRSTTPARQKHGQGGWSKHEQRWAVRSGWSGRSSRPCPRRNNGHCGVNAKSSTHSPRLLSHPIPQTTYPHSWSDIGMLREVSCFRARAESRYDQQVRLNPYVIPLVQSKSGRCVCRSLARHFSGLFSLSDNSARTDEGGTHFPGRWSIGIVRLSPIMDNPLGARPASLDRGKETQEERGDG